MQLINIHTHQLPAPGGKTILSLHHNFEQITPGRFYSIAIHPWYIQADAVSQFSQVKTVATSPSVQAIGETGLDKLCDTDFSLQQQVFVWQVELAGKLGKPLIIHCVKAWNEVLATIRQLQPGVPVIFHGFNKSPELAKRITGEGHYLSFGQSLSKKTVAAVLQTIPASQLFLETDDALVSIEEIYKLAAAALSIDMNSLSLQLQKNAGVVFGPDFLP